MDVPPSDETEIILEEFELTRSLVIQWTILGFVGFLVALAVFGAIYTATTGTIAELSFRLDAGDTPDIAVSFIIIIILTLIVIIPHELVHGALMSIYGGSPEYGTGIAYFILPYAYATSEGTRFTRNQFIAIALAPLIVISVIGTALMIAFQSLWFVIPLAANAGGAIGDLWMTVVLLRYPPDVRVEDRQTEMRIYGHPGDVRPESSLGTTIRYSLLGGILCFGVMGVSAMIFAPIVLTELGATSLSLGIPGTPWMLFEYETTVNGGFSSALHPGGLLVISTVVGLLYGSIKQIR